MTPSGANGDGAYGAPEISAAARVRAKGPDFTASFFELREAVEGACGGQSAWEGKVVAGIRAVLAFAAREPEKAIALTLSARRPGFGERNPEQVVLAHFASLLSETAPDRKLIAVSTDESVVESIAAVVRGHLLGGTERMLPGVAPDLVYLALLPYLGLAETERWAASTDLSPR